MKAEPFCPVHMCALKHLTLKVCMLLALSSARRADDLSKLSCRSQKCVLLENKIILTPDALLKQDRVCHVGEPIVIESFVDKDLDVVTLLPIYLKKVKQLRTDVNSLFVTHVKPYKRPSAQTVSRWLVQLIQMAYEKEGLILDKVTGHSTRALAPSWAEFKGVPVSEILRVADWASAKTFYSHYWRQLERKVNDAVLSVSDDC